AKLRKARFSTWSPPAHESRPRREFRRPHCTPFHKTSRGRSPGSPTSSSETRGTTGARVRRRQRPSAGRDWDARSRRKSSFGGARGRGILLLAPPPKAVLEIEV